MVSMTNCNALTNVINFDMTQIPTVTLNNSYDADELYMSKTTNLSLVNMANIKKLIFVPNNEHESFNLTELRNSPDYTISAINCPSLKTFMTTAPYRDSYTNGEYGEVAPNTAFCANTLDISNTKITDVNFLCTTDLYQLKLPDTVNNFICDSAYDLDTYHLPDGDFNIVHHELIDAYTTDYNKRTSVGEYIAETNVAFTKGKYIDDKNVEHTEANAYISNKIYIKGGTTFTFYQSQMWYSTYYITQYDEYGNFIKGDYGYGSWLGGNDVAGVQEIVSNTAYIIMSYNKRVASNDKVVDSPTTLYRMEYYVTKTPNLIPSSADGSLIFSMYAPTVNTAVPAEGIWDLYGLTFEEFYTYGMNNNIVVSGDNITMPHRYADYNITIQNANITPTNYPTMLYPLLVNENKPVTGTINYTNYQGDDLSYAMAYANTSEVDIDIPSSVILNSLYFHNIDKESEYQYADPRTIVKYKCTSNATPVTLPNDYNAYSMIETDNNDGTYTVTIIANDLGNLPSSINFQKMGAALLEVININTDGITTMSTMFQGCTNLTSLDASNWNTSNVKQIYHMFLGCTNLTSLDASNWDTSNLVNTTSMFSGCSKLTSLDISNWETSNITHMASMFNKCSSLTSLDVSNWDTSKVVAMDSMFNSCSKLTSIDVSNWDTSKVTTMTNMFSGCSSLSEVIGIDKWYCPALTSVGSMFQNAGVIRVDASSWKRGENGEATFDTVFSFVNNKYTQYLDISGWKFTSSNTNFSNFPGNATTDIRTFKWSNWTHTIYLANVPKLTAESVSGLVANLAVVTDGQTLTLHPTHIANLSSAEIKSATDKGWTIITD